ncbi:MAG: hypothetical protein HFJ85_07955 [Oscillospiraceae bacterium]|nr:hypothetical protein [Oscillospiraceae bacterium]
MIRATTGGVLRGYKTGLMSSFIRLNSARDTVLTQRKFNSYAEDPAAAAQSYQLHRAFQRTDSQITISNSTIRKFSTAYTAVNSVVDMVDNEQTSSSWYAVLRAANQPTGSGRTALGVELKELAESIVQTMNNQYGNTFSFAGADGLNVPFTWEGEGEDRKLCYRGIPVDVKIPEERYDDPLDPTKVTNADEIAKAKEQLQKLDYLKNESRYVDIGLGLKEDSNGKLIESSAFNDSLSGIDILGYGTDEDGDPKNIASIIYRMGVLLTNCDEATGAWKGGEHGEECAEFQRLAEKFSDSAAEVKKSHVELSTKVAFLENNHKQLITTADTINEQLYDIERCDLAEAITSYSWAQYCYNAALKMGNSILSGSLMDYLN